MFFGMPTEYEQMVESKPIATFYGKDTSMDHQLYLMYGEEERPLFYYANIQTPVCIDSLCKPLYIEVYWNLLGNYTGFGVYQEQLLTKYDHDLFEPVDYEKLHRLLLDKHSILERRKLTDLFDPNAVPDKQIEYKGQKVDAISGATRREIRESVVAGGLFSCYTLWHLVNGEVVTSIRRLLDEQYSPVMEQYFLHSGYEDYQYYAIKQMSGQTMTKEFSSVLGILREARPLVRSYILKKLPAEVWTDQRHAADLYHFFGVGDTNSKTLLVKNLDLAHPVAFEHLSMHVEDMTKQQLKGFLSTLSNRKDGLTPTLMSKLQKVASSQYSYNYLVQAFIEQEKR